MSHRLLYRSAFWEIARPCLPLTAGHVLIRLSDPSTEFAHSSAADWLFCHNRVRDALNGVLGTTRVAVMFAYRWHPLGPAIGEPVAESSTPTFHLFGRWKGEPTTPGLQLLLPAHRRMGEPKHDLEAVDDALRESLGGNRPDASGPAEESPPEKVTFEPQARAAVVPDIGPDALVTTYDAGPRHAIIQPSREVSFISDILSEELLAMAAALGALPLDGGLNGYSCLALEPEESGSALRVHALGRSAAEEDNPLVSLLRSPEVSLALL